MAHDIDYRLYETVTNTVTMEDVMTKPDALHAYTFSMVGINNIVDACCAQLVEIQSIIGEVAVSPVMEDVDAGLSECRLMTKALLWLMRSHVCDTHVVCTIYLPVRLIWHIQMLHEGGHMTDAQYLTILTSHDSAL